MLEDEGQQLVGVALMSSSTNAQLQWWCHSFHYSLLSIQSPNFLLQILECIQATYKLIARGAVCMFVFVCVCRCLGQVTLGMHCPFVLSCSCASTRALSLIHTDLVKSDVKNVACQHLIPFVISQENVYLFGDVLGQMELRGWGCGVVEG